MASPLSSATVEAAKRIFAVGGLVVLSSTVYMSRLQRNQADVPRPMEDAILAERSRRGGDNSRRTAEVVQEMLDGLKYKTTAEKLDAAVDAAINTHHIGFPQSRPRGER